MNFSNQGDRWTQTTELSPNQQALLTGQEELGMGLNNLAGNQIDTLNDTLGQSFDPRRFNSSSVTGGPLDINQTLGQLDMGRYDPTTQLGDFSGVEDETYRLATDRLGGEFDRSEESLRAKLANQGVAAGSDAFGAEMKAFNEGKGDAYSNARLAARDTALRTRGQAAGELAQGADTALAGRGQQLQELLTGRTQNLAEGEADYSRDYAADLAERQIPLQEIMGILNGTPLNPVNPGEVYTRGVSDTDVAGITQNGFANQMGIYNSQMSSRNALLGSIFGLGGSALGAM